MGTSTNQRSPNTPNWRAAQLAYVEPGLPIDRTIQEVWRAALNQPTGNLLQSLSTEVVSDCLRITVESESREAALARASRHIAQSGEASLGAVIAQRAVALAFAEERDRTTAFASCLFAEASNYLVARDLPGFVGAGGRASSVSEAILFKRAIRDRIMARVEAVPRPKRPGDLARNWAAYVDAVTTGLARTAGGDR